MAIASSGASGFSTAQVRCWRNRVSVSAKYLALSVSPLEQRASIEAAAAKVSSGNSRKM
ncbi:MAG: hypothetical protein WDN48_05080 [Pseudolabrys sp.]